MGKKRQFGLCKLFTFPKLTFSYLFDMLFGLLLRDISNKNYLCCNFSLGQATIVNRLTRPIFLGHVYGVSHIAITRGGFAMFLCTAMIYE